MVEQVSSPGPLFRANHTHGTLLAGLWLVLAGLPGYAAEASPQTPDYAEPLNRLGQELDELLDDERVAGAAIAAVDGDAVVWIRNFGHANRGNKTKVENSTRFQAGDFTKIITAIAVLQQVEAGHFGLDDRVDQLIPGIEVRSQYPDRPAPTVRQLLTHHAGLPTAQLAGSYQLTASPGLAPLIPMDIVQPTGEIYAYSHLGFSVLGHLVERYSKQSYARYIEDRVLKPIGMSGAGFSAAPSDALGHDKRRRPEPNLFPRDLAALGLMASANDFAQLIRWMLSEDTRPVLARRWVDEMTRVQNGETILDLDNRMGLAWQLTNTGRHRVDRVLRINTSTIHYRGILLIAPKERLGLVVMANGSPAIDFVLEAARATLDELLQVKFGIEPPVMGHGMPEHLAIAGQATPDAMQSRYATPLGLASFAGDAQRFNMAFLGRSFSARQRADGWFELSYRLLWFFEIRFSLLEDILVRPVQLAGHRLLLGWYQGTQFLLGTALDGQTEGGLAALTGRYRLMNPDALSESLSLEEIHLEIIDGLLVASYRLPLFVSLHPKLPLIPMGNDRYRIPGLGTNLGEIVHIDAQTHELHYSGYRFKKTR